MAKNEVTAIFDIGKTNKKFFLFDKNYNEVHKEYIHFDQIEDDDGFPTENIEALQSWLKTCFDRILQAKKYNVTSINFSTYGASLVHLDQHGKPLTPLYNYLKPLPKEVEDLFYETYGSKATIAAQTASPQSGFLNSGLQLFWLKRTQPDLFKQIRYTLHLPQYLSYLFTGIPLSDYTSIGCHTNLWNYQTQDYHHWVHQEGFDALLPPIVSTKTSINLYDKERFLKIGVGIHDSSAALLPYLLVEKKPFLLLSTGTWSVAMNPFTEELLTPKDLENNCLYYMQINGNPVRASRFFMGNEYKLQVKKITEYFQKPEGYHRGMKFNPVTYQKLKKGTTPRFKFEGIQLKHQKAERTQLHVFDNFEEAYHQLMIELLELQFQTIERAIGTTPIKKIYIDGGFTDNDIFVKLIADHFSQYKVRTTKSPLGSALGAAMVMCNNKLGKRFFKEHYQMKKMMPLQSLVNNKQL